MESKVIAGIEFELVRLFFQGSGSGSAEMNEDVVVEFAIPEYRTTRAGASVGGGKTRRRKEPLQNRERSGQRWIRDDGAKVFGRIEWVGKGWVSDCFGFGRGADAPTQHLSG